MCRILRILVSALVVAALPVASRADAQELPTPVAQTDDQGDASDVPGALSGADAFVSLLLEGELTEVAAGIDLTAGELAHTLLTDDSLFVTDDGEVGYADDAPDPGEFTTAEPPPAHADASSVFTLHSQPTAPLTIFLDFDGHITRDTSWNKQNHVAEIASLPFATDATPGSLSLADVAAIEAVWQIVAEDFAPFNVDVTTEDPGIDALEYTGRGDVEYGTRIVISPTYAWLGEDAKRFGGIAYIGSFKAKTPAFVFSDNLGRNYKAIGDASSHEAGHTLGLHHDGTSHEPYYSGHDDWGPIMGDSYSRVLAQWSKGEYADADRTKEDDLAQLDARLGYRADDHGNTASTATLLAGTGEASGIVGGDDLVDVFAVDVANGSIAARVTPISAITSNLFASVTIIDSDGTVVAENTPTNVTTSRSGSGRNAIDWVAVAGAAVPNGRYMVEVRPAGLGTPSTGFSSYGSHGAYRLAVAVGLPGQVRLTPIQPVRLADTRSGGGRLLTDGVLRVRVAGTVDVPANATAAALNVTAVGPHTGGFLTVYPCSATVPTTSTVNFAAGRDIANSTIATLAVDGDVCIYASATTDVIVDITGWLSPSAATRMSPTAPHRVADTRSSLGGFGRLSADGVLTIAPGEAQASAVAMNVTAVGADEAGFLTVYPCGTQPPVASTVNFAQAEARPNNTIVAVGSGGLVCVYSSAAVDVIVDITAAFSADGELEYLPADPQRLVDTRTTGVVAAGGEIAFAVPSPGVPSSAVSVNVTATGHDTDGFSTAFGCGTAVPEASTVNQRVGEDNANGAIVPSGIDSTECVFTSSATNLIVDLNGWWLPAR